MAKRTRRPDAMATSADDPRQDQQQDRQAERNVDGLDVRLRRRVVWQDLVHVPAEAELNDDQQRDQPVERHSGLIVPEA